MSPENLFEEAVEILIEKCTYIKSVLENMTDSMEVDQLIIYHLSQRSSCKG